MEGKTLLDEFEADVLVAGGGVGGLMAAAHAQRAGARVLLLGGSGGASSRISSMNTALGYSEDDTPARLFDDMYRAGGYLSSPAVLAALTARIEAATKELEQLGVPFHRDGDRLARRQAAGSTWTRAVFSVGMVGVDISRALRGAMLERKPHLTEIRGGQLQQLTVEDGCITGGLAFDPRREAWVSIKARAVVLATGGCGQLFGRTTNPRGSKGTGYALALEAGAELVDMEFVSFEPFVTSAPADAVGYDLPTTVLREGAKLRNGLGQEFLDTASAPTKDIICRAMVREVLEGRGTPSGSVLYDIRGMDATMVERYVQITEPLRARGLTLDNAQFEVMPAQHFLMGGVRVDATGASTVPGLYAVGEAAGGAHGAHRLAAAGGMEVVAAGSIAGGAAARYAHDARPKTRVAEARPRPELLGLTMGDAARSQLGSICAALDSGCGILRQGSELVASVQALQSIVEQTQNDDRHAFVWRGAIVALAIASSGLAREESRGDHYRLDFPSRNDAHWFGNHLLSLDGPALTLRLVSRSEPDGSADTRMAVASVGAGPSSHDRPA
jgi:aspartate oxidase